MGWGWGGASFLRLDIGACYINIYTEQSLRSRENTPHSLYIKTNMHCMQADFTSEIVLCSTRYAYWMGTRNLRLNNYATATPILLSSFCFNYHLLLRNCCFIVMIHIWEERNAVYYSELSLG